jgi:hypothetical protein
MGDSAFLECLWDVYALVSDTGIQYYALYSYNRFIGAIVTFMGLMFAATLTGFVVNAVMEKMNDLRKGKSAVKEWDHTLLIGWTDRSIAFIQQIFLANESSGGGIIVVLSERGKEEMEAELHSTVTEEDLMGTTVVFRSVSPLNAFDLRRAACETARSVVVMATGDTHSAADAATLRVVIALKTFPELLGHVVGLSTKTLLPTMEVQGLRWLAPRAAAACLVVSIFAINASASASPSWYQLPPDWVGEPAETPAYGSTTNGGTLSSDEASELHGEFWHKPLFPMDATDYAGVLCAALGLILASGGGIGGGGMLVPLYVLVMGFSPKHAIPLSNVTVFGGSLANHMVNRSKRHPSADRPLVDYDLTLVMQPMTIAGALLVSLANKLLPEVVLTVCLVLLLALTTKEMLEKGFEAWAAETKAEAAAQQVRVSGRALIRAPWFACTGAGLTRSRRVLRCVSVCVRACARGVRLAGGQGVGADQASAGRGRRLLGGARASRGRRHRGRRRRRGDATGRRREWQPHEIQQQQRQQRGWQRSRDGGGVSAQGARAVLGGAGARGGVRLSQKYICAILALAV